MAGSKSLHGSTLLKAQLYFLKGLHSDHGPDQSEIQVRMWSSSFRLICVLSG